MPEANFNILPVVALRAGAKRSKASTQLFPTARICPIDFPFVFSIISAPTSVHNMTQCQQQDATLQRSTVSIY